MTRERTSPKPPLWFRYAALIFGGLCAGMSLTLTAHLSVAGVPVALVALFMVALSVAAPAGRRAAQ